MSIAEILLQDFDVEISNTRRTLERVPEDTGFVWDTFARNPEVGIAMQKDGFHAL